ncbi:hypothetical protein Poly51_46850 [Rubripirellula tenax]|uniref:Transglycosylase associated protein n=1 Tax=Rubripirellula tenax TaxID=2528015 RepID=A0A5C6EIA9_9BACT|nr:GlsB/YeaQ/YmgE family stress response membrane protein [Rubripirellula tenax]TWU48782.1 hypothetical protein Poly51_46850 [Rubripirellula tenax]
MFWIIGWIIFGLIIGMLARKILPGEQPMSLIQTLFLGIAGSFIGGLIGFFLVGGSPIQSSGWIGSTIGAVILLALQYRSFKRIN